MQWLIQCTNLPDNQSTKLLEAIKERSLPFVGIGVRPFTHEVLDLDKADPNLPTMFYGSTQLVEMVSTWDNYKPGVFYQKEWFDPRNWVGKRSDLLNEDQQEILVKDLRNDWVDEPKFIKSVEAKKLTGMVIEPVKEDQDNWLIEHSELDGNEILVISPALNIETECRFFVLDGEIITGSTYRWLGCRTIRRPVEDGMQQAARLATKEWMPNGDIVIDICRLKNGEYKVVEFNAVNSSGFYNSDVGKIVQYFEDHCYKCKHLIFSENHTCGLECNCEFCGVGE